LVDNKRKRKGKNRKNEFRSFQSLITSYAWFRLVCD
jgi:hypothetical protein